VPLYEYRCPHCAAVIAKLFSVRDAPRRNTAGADPDRLINRRGDIAKGRDDP